MLDDIVPETLTVRVLDASELSNVRFGFRFADREGIV